MSSIPAWTPNLLGGRVDILDLPMTYRANMFCRPFLVHFRPWAFDASSAPQHKVNATLWKLDEKAMFLRKEAGQVVFTGIGRAASDAWGRNVIAFDVVPDLILPPGTYAFRVVVKKNRVMQAAVESHTFVVANAGARGATR
jgi:hypothetical protein